MSIWYSGMIQNKSNIFMSYSVTLIVSCTQNTQRSAQGSFFCRKEKLAIWEVCLSLRLKKGWFDA